MTPEELEKQRQKEQLEREKFKQKLRLARTIAGTVAVEGISQLRGLDKLNQAINEKVAALQTRATDQLLELATKLGIEGLDTGNPTLPNLCPPREILQIALNLRNNLVDDIEVVAKYVNIIDGSLKVISDVLNGSITTLTAINTLKTTSSVAAKLAPTLPGSVTALLSDLDDIRTLLTFKTDGTPKLPELKRAVSIGGTYISQASQALNTLIVLLSFIDLVLQKCGEQVEEIPIDISTLTAIVENVGNTDTVYRGFTFEIVEKPFSPTLKQKIAQAKNKQGIVLLQTEPSFTQDPQVLINELKLIIDRDNLQADAGVNIVTPQAITPSVAPKNRTANINRPIPPPSPPPSINTDPFGYPGSTVGEEAALPRQLGDTEDIYQWNGRSWDFVGTKSI